MWATAADLCNLASEFSFKGEFPDPRWTALAAKLRVIHTVAPDCKKFKDELLHCQLECGRRPFPAWHDKCFFSVLSNAEEKLAAKGVNRREISKRLKSEPEGSQMSFQRLAESQIRKTHAAPYFRDARLRAKCCQWKFSVLDGHLESRVMKAMSLINSKCPARVHAAYFRTLWNGWVCYDRMKQLLQQRGCLLGCGWDDDALSHYGCCNLYWKFVATARPQGLGLNGVKRGRDATFLISPMLQEDDIVRMAIGLYALYRTINFLRFAAAADTPYDVLNLLWSFAKQAVAEHPAQRYLRH